jgi:ferredoxin
LRPFLLSQKKKIVTPQQMSFVTSKFLHKRAEVSVTFIRLDGTKLPAKGKEGENLLDIIIDQEIDIDGFGACEGTLACSTCHLIFKQTDFDKIPDEATDEELDMLDLAYGLQTWLPSLLD